MLGARIAASLDEKKNLMNLQMTVKNSCLMTQCLCFEVEIPLELMVYMAADFEKLTWMKYGLQDVELVGEKLAGLQVKCVETVLEKLRKTVVQ